MMKIGKKEWQTFQVTIFIWSSDNYTKISVNGRFNVFFCFISFAYYQFIHGNLCIIVRFEIIIIKTIIFSSFIALNSNLHDEEHKFVLFILMAYFFHSD